jgi:hypothetical protein
MVMLTRQRGGHRLIVGIRPQATDLTPPLVASNFEAIFAKILQHGQPAGAWLFGVSTLNLRCSNPDILTSANNGDRLLPHSVF